MPAMLDVAVIGGGPAGLLASARLAAAGLQTTVLEEHKSIGEPVHCTGVLAAEAFDEFDLSRRSLLNELTTARFWSPAGQQVSYSGGRVEAVVIDRQLFDGELADRARRAGACITTGARVTGIRTDADGVTVTTTCGEVRARSAVLASGANYALHRQVGLRMPSLFLHTAQMEVPARRLHDVELYFGSANAPKGFGWVVPVVRGDAQSARVGVMCENDALGYFARLAARVSDRWGLELSAARPRQKILPLAPLTRTYTDRLVAIGDAAGLVKPTTGGGIYYSLVSAAWAADVLKAAFAANDLSAARLAPYERRWRDKLSAEFDAQLKLRLAAHRMSDSDIEDLFDLARTDGVMPIVRRTASFNRHRTLILALFKHPPVRALVLRKFAF